MIAQPLCFIPIFSIDLTAIVSSILGLIAGAALQYFVSKKMFQQQIEFDEQNQEKESIRRVQPILGKLIQKVQEITYTIQACSNANGNNKASYIKSYNAQVDQVLPMMNDLIEKLGSEMGYLSKNKRRACNRFSLLAWSVSDIRKNQAQTVAAEIKMLKKTYSDMLPVLWKIQGRSGLFNNL